MRSDSESSSSNLPQVIFTVPTGNFGDILAGYFAHRMGLPITRLAIATNSNDILHRFFLTGAYTKSPAAGPAAQNGFTEDGAKAHPEGAKETLSPAMDILVSSNFERLLWYLAYRVLPSEQSTVQEQRKIAGERVKGWLGELKTKGGFAVEPEMLQAAKEIFGSERVDDEQTVNTIRAIYKSEAAKEASTKALATRGTRVAGRYVLDPHSAVGITSAIRTAGSLEPETRSETHQIALATAHPAKFSKAVELALRDEPDFRFQEVLPEEFIGLEDKKRNMTVLKPGETLEGLRDIITKELAAESHGKR